MTVNYFRRAALGVALLTSLGCSRDATPATPAQPSPPLQPAAGRQVAPKPAPSPARPRCLENFALFDSNGDGRVSLDEFEAHPHPHAEPAVVFHERDLNGDGVLSEAEFCSGLGAGPSAQQRGGPGAAAGGRGPRVGAGQEPGAPPRARPMGREGAEQRCQRNFLVLDENRDGRVTDAEFSARPHRGDSQALFVERDRDGDGTLDPAEFCKRREAPPGR